MTTTIAVVIFLCFLVAVGVVIYKSTTPQFLTSLVAQAVSTLVPIIFKSSPHSQEWWDIKHQIMQASSKSDREYYIEKLKELEAKESKG